MSKTKSLCISQIEEVRQLVVDGVQPQKIADQYGVGVSTIHNYKKEFKNEGTSFPVVRGRQTQKLLNTQPPGQILNHRVPGTKIITGNELVQYRQPRGMRDNEHTSQPGQPVSGQASVFVINGISIQISSQAKAVSIDKGDEGVVFKITI